MSSSLGGNPALSVREGRHQEMNLTKAEELVKDPVCGMIKPKEKMGAEYIFMGKAYYFCTEGDKKMFEAHPEHWLPRKVSLGKSGK